ncbi:hypothetical protein QBC35DRAFT_518003 [Podospora australis]|uniref:Uncharacterized protein n=1 Tax=Podospora australis TaxID=1536484 RepID=A0AAN6WKU2_9PEZI|nr:hypothetical protein QBC35DRAFT_518003 [Podospora australis]
MPEVPNSIAQRLRSRWTNKTETSFRSGDFVDYLELPAVDYEREINFKGCRSITFMNGNSKRGEDVIMILGENESTGKMMLPPNVQVLVTSGYAKCTNNFSTDGSTVVGSGARAPAPSRTGSGYPESSYSGYTTASRGNITPPSDAAAFGRAASNYTSGSFYADGPAVPRGGAYNDGFEVTEQAENFDERIRDSRTEVCSIAPSESISSVGSRGVRSNQW